VAPLLALASARPFSAARDGIGGYRARCGAAVTEAGSTGKEHASSAGLASETKRKKQGKVKDLNRGDY